MSSYNFIGLETNHLSQKAVLMDALRKYVGLTVNLENIKDTDRLKELGFVCRYLPDPPEDFDEFEFVTAAGGIENLGLMVTVETMKIKRIFFGIISPDNPDVVTGLSEAEVKRIFEQSGNSLMLFFDYITA
jgi:hypothetical protein